MMLKLKSVIGASVAALAIAGAATLAQAGSDQDRPTTAPAHPSAERMSLNPARHGPYHICRAGYSWQYGCLSYGPAGPGQLFGACTAQGYACMRDAGPIQ